MSSTNELEQEVSVERQRRDRAVTGVETGTDTPELRASVEQETQATVDTNHPDATPDGLPLAAEERLAAREMEIERTRTRFDRRPDSDREARSRRAAARASAERHEEFRTRAASVHPELDPERPDPRERLSQSDLAGVNRQAARLAAELRNGPTTSALSRRLAQRVARGQSLASASVAVMEAMRQESGVVQPISSVDPEAFEATIEGEVTRLFDPADASQQQVGWVVDGSGRIKLTIWKASRQHVRLREGDVVRVTAGKVGRYRGKATLAADSRTRIEVLERGDGPAPMWGREQSDGTRTSTEQDIAWYRTSVRNRPG